METPSNYRIDELFPYCELTAIGDGDVPIDFTGLQTYKIGFLKEGFGFGITDIRIEISPSMQPIIEISFKDMYGNMAIGFEDNKSAIGNIAGTNDIGNFNFSKMFSLPYPKFQLLLKGYLGNPVKFELNVKKITVSLVPTDGSYEIKATFVPNIYGFFADLPYYFLHAVKSLRFDGIKDKTERNNLEKKYSSITDIIKSGKMVQDDISTIQNLVTQIKQWLQALKDGTDEIMNIDFFKGIEGIDGNGQSITGFKNMYFNVKHQVQGRTAYIQDLDKPEILTRFKSYKGQGKNIQRALVSSISVTSPAKPEIDLYEIINEKDVRFLQGIKVINDNIKILEEWTNSKILKGTNEKLQQVTIGNVFDLLIKDSAFLMGKILEAAKKGADTRGNDKRLIGKYFPLIQNENFEQIPYPNAVKEKQFVQKFIDSLTTGIYDNTKSGANESTSNMVGPQNDLVKRISNIELLSSNPYNKTNGDKFIQNAIERSAIASHFMLFTSRSKSSDLEDVIASEISNIKPAISTLSETDKLIVDNFCNTIISFIDKEGNLIKSDGSSINTNSVADILATPIKTLDNGKTIGSFIKPYTERIIGLNTETYKSDAIIHNGLLYLVPKLSGGTSVFANGGLTYIMFKKDTKDISYFANEKSTRSIDDDDLEFQPVNKDVVHNTRWLPDTHINEEFIQKKLMLDYSKLKRDNLGDLQDVFFTTEFDENNLDKDTYYYARYLDWDLGETIPMQIFDLFGTSKSAKNQRRILYSLCESMKTGITESTKEKTEKVQEIITKLQEQSDVFYIQFHHLTNNWKNLLDTANLTHSTADIPKRLEQFFMNNKDDKTQSVNNVVYDIPLQNYQQPKKIIDLRNAIIDIEPLIDDNSNTTVLNVMGNICHKNNFLFLSIPGNGFKDFKSEEIFKPYVGDLTNISAINTFYILWMPTPENRVFNNNQDQIYSNFKPSFIKQPFEINFGDVNNTIVKSIDITTEDSKITAESAIAVSRMVDGKNQNQLKGFNCSALSVMEGRSYRLRGEMIGNAQLSPTMFFVINRIPIFNGLYQIMKISHRLTPNNFTTGFEAIKMKYAGDDQGFVSISPLTIDGLKTSSSSNYDGIGVLKNPPAAATNRDFIERYKNDRYGYIKSKEGKLLKPYPDSKSYSIGYGHYLIDDLKKGYLKIGDTKISNPVLFSSGITDKQAEELFLQDVQVRESTIRTKISYDTLTENKKGAVLSYFYNTGRLPRNIGIYIDKKDHIQAADTIRNGIATEKGQIKQFLVDRRNEEADLYIIE